MKKNHKLDINNEVACKVEQTVAGTYVIQNRRFMYVNSAFARMFGYSGPEEVMQSSKVYQLVKPDLRRDVADNAGCRIREGNANARHAFKAIKRDGAEFEVEIHNSVVKHEGHRFIVGVAVDISEIRELSTMAFYDALTGLPNRALLFDRLQTAIKSAQRSRHRLAVLFMDLDHFKPVNDKHGHVAGDAVLQESAARFSSVLRSVDTIARLGGDEFVVLIPDFESESDVLAVARRLEATLSDPIRVGECAFNLGVSIGVSFFPEHGSTPEELYAVADKAMYEAKAKRATQFYTPAMQAQAEDGVR